MQPHNHTTVNNYQHLANNGEMRNRKRESNGDDVGPLGHTVELAGDGAGHVGAVTVAVAVLAITGEVIAPLGPLAELDVGRLHTAAQSPFKND
jgi:hypothetical protein